MQNLDVAILQTDLFWEDIDANLEHLTKLMAVAPAADLYVLPEMFTTAFSMQPQRFAKQSFEKGLTWMRQMAAQHNAAITGSIMVEEDSQYYNRLFFVLPSGVYYIYNKKHLFGLGKENQNYAPGNELLIVDYKGWKICPLICYDLRFPVWSRNTTGYDILIYVANWPIKRAHHWRALLQARAIENQCYVIGCNRVGEDGNNLAYSGNSMLVDFGGNIIAEEVGKTAFLTTSFVFADLEDYRQAFPFLADKDKFIIS